MQVIKNNVHSELVIVTDNAVVWVDKLNTIRVAATHALSLEQAKELTSAMGVAVEHVEENLGNGNS